MKPKKALLGWKSQLPLVAFYVAASSVPAFAVDRTWDGSVNSYNTPASWTGGIVPVGVDRPFINSGTVQVGAADPDWNLTAGLSVGGTGTLTQSSKTITSPGEIWIGQGTSSAATYNLSGGTINVSNWLAVGRASGGGILNISGGTINKTGNGNFIIGSGLNATGVVNQTAGTFNGTATPTWLGEVSNLGGGAGNGPGSGTYNLSGTGTANLALLRVGHGGSGPNTFNLDGGTLATTKIEKDAAANGTFNFNGGVLKARQNEAAFLQGLTAANVKTGGAIIDSNGFTVTIGQPLLDADAGNTDTLTKRGTGAVILSGASTFSGNVTIEGGALVARTTTAIPGWNTANRVTVLSNTALGASLDVAGFSQTDFETLLSSADMQAGSAVAIDTSLANLTYATDIAALPTGLGAAVGFQKVGANTLTLNMPDQTFTGTIVANPTGTLLLNSLATGQTQSLVSVGTGILAIDNATDQTFSNPLSGTGNFTFQGNGNKTLVGATTVGSLTKAGTGSFTIGTGGFTSNGNFAAVGGQINLNGATLTVGGETQIGQGVGGNAILQINTGDTLTANNWFAVGRGGGTGTLNLNGGTVTKATGAGQFMVGARDGGASVGIVNHTSGTLTVTNSEMWIGQNAYDAGAIKSTGTYNLSGGAVVINSWLAVGREGGNGTLNITGGSFTKQGANNVEIGGNDTSPLGSIGVISVSGGTFTANGETRIGLKAPGTGTLNVSSAGIVNVNAIRLAFANNGIGTVNLNGGTLNTTRIEKVTAGSGSVNFNGGTLVAKEATATFINGLDSANVKAGGATINSNGFDITVGQALLADSPSGGLTKLGAGKLTLSGANTYTGNTTVTGGVLSLSSAYLANTSSVVIGATGTLDLTHGLTDQVAGLTVNGIVKANGIYDSTTDPGFITGSGKIEVVGGGATGYDAFKANPANGLTAGVNDGPNADPDGDGISNLLEFVLGGLPNGAGASNTSILPTQAIVGTDLVVSFKRADASEGDLTLKVEWSSDLVNWGSPKDVVIGASTSGIVAITEDTPNAATDTVVVSIPRAANEVNGKLFARVRATRP